MVDISELENMAVELRIWQTVFENTPLYPMAVCGENGYNNRSQFMEGWNEAITDYIHRVYVISAYIKALSDKERKVVEELMVADEISIAAGKDDMVYMHIPINDMFEYATADSEVVETKDLEDLAYLYHVYGSDGLVAWVAKKRGWEPLKECRSDKYKEARKSLG